MSTIKPEKIELNKCLSCGQIAIHKYKPFCSSRCSQIDLSKWLNEVYRVPVFEVDDSNEKEFLDDES